LRFNAMKSLSVRAKPVSGAGASASAINRRSLPLNALFNFSALALYDCHRASMTASD
jgi:hypothetical protein